MSCPVAGWQLAGRQEGACLVYGTPRPHGSRPRVLHTTHAETRHLMGMSMRTSTVSADDSRPQKTRLDYRQRRRDPTTYDQDARGWLKPSLCFCGTTPRLSRFAMDESLDATLYGGGNVLRPPPTPSSGFTRTCGRWSQQLRSARREYSLPPSNHEKKATIDMRFLAVPRHPHNNATLLTDGTKRA